MYVNTDTKVSIDYWLLFVLWAFWMLRLLFSNFLATITFRIPSYWPLESHHKGSNTSSHNGWWKNAESSGWFSLCWVGAVSLLSVFTLLAGWPRWWEEIKASVTLLAGWPGWWEEIKACVTLLAGWPGWWEEIKACVTYTLRLFWGKLLTVKQVVCHFVHCLLDCVAPVCIHLWQLHCKYHGNDDDDNDDDDREWWWSV